MRFPALLALLATAGACGRQEAPGDASPASAGPKAEIAATDELGSFSARINGIAFWSHPSIPFNGLALVATEDGLVALNIEDGAVVARVDAVHARGVDVAYVGRGAEAQGYALLDAAEKNASDGGFRIYAIDNETRALTLIPSMFIAEGDDGRGFCLSRDKGGAIVVNQMLARGFSSRALSVVQGMITSGDARNTNFKGGFVACAGDALDGSIFAVTDTGDIYRIDDRGAVGEKPFATSGVSNPIGIGISLNGLVEGGDTAQCCGQLAVADGADGSIHLFDREDGKAIGVVKMRASFDVQGVGAATAMGLGYGNFGAVYRDGVVALATDGENPALRLTPLNAVMDGLSIPLGPAANPRDLNPQPEEEALDFSLKPPPNP